MINRIPYEADGAKWTPSLGVVVPWTQGSEFGRFRDRRGWWASSAGEGSLAERQ